VRLNAYVLAGDPAWIAQSIGSYYHLVDRIVVSYDRSGRSWAGHKLSVQESLDRIVAADPQGKILMLPGDFSDSDRFVLDVETEHRQSALDAASEGADWVIQLDTDELLRSPSTFTAQLAIADQRGADALEFPARIIHARTPSGRFLEQCGRFWTTQSAYPGPVAVRAGSRLSHARQAAGSPMHRVDVAPWNTDPAHPWNAPVHAVISPAEAILHMSWVRTEAQMAEKRLVSGYAGAVRWDAELRRWRSRARHPWLTAAGTPVARNPLRRFRVTSLPSLARADP
jgi:hypothetical protein